MTRHCLLTPHKLPHPSRADAQRAADDMNARWRGRQRTTVYRCSCGCGSWFITHKGKRTRMQRFADRVRRRQP